MTKKATKELIHLERADGLDPDAFAKKMADAVVGDLGKDVIRRVNEELAKRGEPPLRKG